MIYKSIKKDGESGGDRHHQAMTTIHGTLSQHHHHHHHHRVEVGTTLIQWTPIHSNSRLVQREIEFNEMVVEVDVHGEMITYQIGDETTVVPCDNEEHQTRKRRMIAKST